MKPGPVRYRLFWLLALVFVVWGPGLPSHVAAQARLRSVSDSLARAPRPEKSPRGAMLRSILPGWGQFYNGQVIKGMLVIGGQGALLANALRFNRQANNEAVGSVARNLNIDRRNLMVWFMGGLTLLSMVDAYIDAHLHDFDIGPDLSLRIGPVTTQSGQPLLGVPGVTLHARF